MHTTGNTAEANASATTGIVNPDHRPGDQPIVNGYRIGEQIYGWMNYDELKWLHQKAATMQTIVEVGCFKGRSTYALCSACPGTVYAIDTFQGSPEHETEELSKLHDEFYENCANHFRNLRVFPMSSMDAARSPLIPKKVDMVFLDGSHEYEDFTADIKHWLPRCTKLFCGHDIVVSGVTRALADMLAEVDIGAVSIWSINPAEYRQVGPTNWKKKVKEDSGIELPGVEITGLTRFKKEDK
jgi:hypothetical protein